MAVYSTQFVKLFAPAPGNYYFTVPANTTAVIRAIDLFSDAGFTGTIANLACSGTFFDQWINNGAAFSRYTYRGRVVVPAGDTFGVELLAAVIFGHVSGYLFD